MGIIKNICLHIALNKEQRLVLWNALVYSDNAYRRHGDVDGAVVTTKVMEQVEARFGIAGKKFTKEEVNAMLQEYAKRVKEDRKEELEDAYQNGRHDAIAEMLENLEHGRGIMVGEIVEVEEEPTPEEKQENKETAEGEGTSAPKEEEAPAETEKQDAGEHPTE